jgi:hypothetical protein
MGGSDAWPWHLLRGRDGSVARSTPLRRTRRVGRDRLLFHRLSGIAASSSLVSLRLSSAISPPSVSLHEKVPLTWKDRACPESCPLPAEGTFPVKNSARTAKITVSADGRGLVSQAGAVLLWETLRVTGLGRGLSAAARVRPEPDLVRDRRPGLRTARLDPDARPGRPGPPLGTQTPEAKDLRRRRAPGRGGRRLRLRLARHWPWTCDLTTAVSRLHALAPG